MSIYLVFSVDQQLRADEGRCPYDNLINSHSLLQSGDEMH